MWGYTAVSGAWGDENSCIHLHLFDSAEELFYRQAVLYAPHPLRALFGGGCSGSSELELLLGGLAEVF